MVEVEVRNFQSIEKASFRIDGFTVVVGRSNIGKSALVRALKACLTGAPASSFVRHGATCVRRLKQAKTCKCYSQVHIKAEGFDLIWEKGDAINRYTFNGQVYDKAERGTPDFLQPLFSPVKVGDRQELLQVSDQFTPIFLLDQTGGAVADTLSDVARLDRINAAMRLAEKDRKEAVSTRKVREKDVGNLRDRLQSYGGLDDTLAALGRVQTQQVGIERTEKALERVDAFLSGVSALAHTIRGLTAVTDIEVPDPSPLSDALTRHDELASLMARQTEREAGIAALTGVEDIEVPALPAVQAKLDLLATLEGWVGRAVELKGWIAPWKAVQDAPTLSSEGLRDTHARSTLLNGFAARLEALEKLIPQLDLELGNVLKEESALREERAALGVCPTCVRPVAECMEGD